MAAIVSRPSAAEWKISLGSCRHLPGMAIIWLKILLPLFVLVFFACRTGGGPSKPGAEDETKSVTEERTRLVHARSIVIDLHADTIQRIADEQLDLDGNDPRLSVTLDAMDSGGLDAQFFSIWVIPSIYSGRQQVERAFHLIDTLKRQIARAPNRIELAASADDIERIVRSGRHAALMGIEGGHALNGEIENLRRFYDAGVRYMTITWANTNEMADSSGDAPRHNGLSAFGEEVIRRMNRLGMMVDVSHVSDKSFRDILRVSAAPVIASHSSCRTLCHHPRNLTDEQLRAIAAAGGVACVNYYSYFLDDDYARRQDAAEQLLGPRYAAINREERDPVRAYTLREKLRTATFEKLAAVSYTRIVDHLEHMISIAGVDHVGLGSDFDGVDSLPGGMKSARDLPRMTEELLRRGQSEENVAKILGGNVLRLMREIDGLKD